MNTSQTKFITLSAMKVTNTEHTAINGNQSISPIPDKRKGRKDSPYGSLKPPGYFCRIKFAAVYKNKQPRKNNVKARE